MFFVPEINKNCDKSINFSKEPCSSPAKRIVLKSTLCEIVRKSQSHLPAICIQKISIVSLPQQTQQFCVAAILDANSLYILCVAECGMTNDTIDNT